MSLSLHYLHCVPPLLEGFQGVENKEVEEFCDIFRGCSELVVSESCPVCRPLSLFSWMYARRKAFTAGFFRVWAGQSELIPYPWELVNGVNGQ